MGKRNTAHVVDQGFAVLGTSGDVETLLRLDTAGAEGIGRAHGTASRGGQKLTRVQKSVQTRNAIIQAAAEIIGEHGYAEASVARIMERAHLGHGTFYAYFASRAELFDDVLPIKGLEFLESLQARLRGTSDLVEMECLAFQSFLEFANRRPWFFRLLHEAEVAAPLAYRKHMDNIMVRYRRALRRTWDRGGLPAYDVADLDTLAYMLISVRDYVYSQNVARSANVPAALETAVNTYRKFISNGLRGASPAG